MVAIALMFASDKRAERERSRACLSGTPSAVRQWATLERSCAPQTGRASRRLCRAQAELVTQFYRVRRALRLLASVHLRKPTR